MITFHRVKFKNILSFGNMWTEVQLDAAPSVLVQGVNGAGKTTFTEAICFALFGKPLRKINKPHLVNHKNKKDMVCEVEFTSNNVSYKVVRGINPQLFEIWQDGELIDQTAAVKDYQLYLERNILHFDYQIFTQIVVLSKANFTSFLKLPAAERRKFIESILNITIFSVMNDVHKLKYNELKSQLSEVSTELKILKDKIDVRRQYIKDLEADAQEQRNQLVHAIESEIAGHQSEIEYLHGKIEDLKSQRMVVDTSLQDNIQSKLESLFDFRARFNAKLSQIDEGIQFFETNHQCPTCSQEITLELRDQKRDAAKAKRDDIEKMIFKVNSDIHTFNLKLNQMMESVTFNTDLNYQIDDLHNKVTTRRSLIDACNARRESSAPDRSKIDAANEVLQDLIKSFGGMLDEKASLVDKSEYFELMSTMLKDTGIKSMVIKKYIPVINQLINKYLKKLGFFIKFVLDENFDETIYSRGIDPLSYANFSEGEKMRIDLAVLFAWREVAQLQNNTSTNLLIFDEVLDSSGDRIFTDAVIKVFKELPSCNVFVISHSPDRWEDSFKVKLTFGKVAGFSKLL